MHHLELTTALYGPLLVWGGLIGLVILIWNRQLVATREEAISAHKEADKAKLLAEEANEAKSKFLASMSHELRTPINAVLGFAQMLQLNPEDGNQTKKDAYVNYILEGGNHLLKLVNDVLDLSKIETHQLNLNVEDITVGEVLTEILSSTVPLLSEREIKIVNNLTFDVPFTVRTDETRFKQCVYNLLSNAIKYNIEGGTITIDGEETEDGFYHLSIKDTGIGIAPSDYEDVFKMFQRLSKNPHVATDGTGVGLTVTKLLVERMAGRIGFESEEGVGSTFWLDLPLSENSNFKLVN